MKNDTKTAQQLLKQAGYTCVLCCKGNLYTSRERGVKPLLEYIDSGIDFSGFCAADKVVGKAAAFLYVLLGVKEVYADVMSEAAAEVLADNDIKAFWSNLTKAIQNRLNTGPCPMEAAVCTIHDAEEALRAVRYKLSEMKNK